MVLNQAAVNLQYGLRQPDFHFRWPMVRAGRAWIDRMGTVPSPTSTLAAIIVQPSCSNCSAEVWEKKSAAETTLPAVPRTTFGLNTSTECGAIQRAFIEPCVRRMIVRYFADATCRRTGRTCGGCALQPDPTSADAHDRQRAGCFDLAEPAWSSGQRRGIHRRLRSLISGAWRRGNPGAMTDKTVGGA